MMILLITGRKHFLQIPGELRREHKKTLKARELEDEIL